METSFALSWVHADDEVPQPEVKVKVKKVIPRLTCESHVWGQWMTDCKYTYTKWGPVLIAKSIGDYRRYCVRRGCKAEQKGRGPASGVNIKVVDTAGEKE